MASYFDTGIFSVEGLSGEILPGAALFWYAAGTSTPLATYSDSALTTANANPVVADAAGRFGPIWLQDAAYKYILTDALGNILVTRDNLVNPTTGAISAAIAAVRADLSSIDPAKGASLIGGAVQVVTSKSIMASLGVTGVRAISVIGDECLWQWRTGDYAARVASDALGGIYQPHASIPASTGCWVRQWDGIHARPEWFGAVANAPATDCYAALQACLNVTGILMLGKGLYYSTRGLLLPDYSVVSGMGEIHTGLVIAHATDHLMRQIGVPGTSYAGGAHLSGFSLNRSVTPTTPSNVADDINQGHGLHFAMVSNPIVNDVYCYDNLVDLYLSNCLSPHIRNIRGLRQTGGAGDRWYGVYVDGVTTGGTFGGPSPNPSSTIIKPNMVAASGVGQSWNYYLKGALQDLWLVDPEAAGGHVEFYIDSNGASAGDFHIVRPIADGYRIYGIYSKGVPIGSSLNIEGAWVAPAAGASSSGIRIEASHGITLSARGDFHLQSGLRMLDVTDSSNIDASIRSAQCQFPAYLQSCQGCDVKVNAYKRYSGADFGTGVDVIGGSRNRIVASARSFETQKWVDMVKIDATASGCMVDVSAVMNDAAASRVTVSGTPVTTQGNLGSHVIINPGAGAML